MMKQKVYWFSSNLVTVCLLLVLFCLTPSLNAVKAEGAPPWKELEKNLQEWMQAGKIPGLILVIIGADGDYGSVLIRGYGYADLETKRPVTADTLFELASCSKAFTTLAVLQLEAKGLINLDAPVSDYLPWFYVTFQQEKYPVTLRQCLHHTSGIPWTTLANIPPGDSDHALEQTVRNIVGTELTSRPGKRFRYATINYDILGAVINKVTGKSYENYMHDYVLTPLGLTSTGVGVGNKVPLMATGYKIGFFQPRKYIPPVFRGNNPAAYIVSNGKDMAKWLRIQLGLVETPLNTLVQKSHQPDLTVPPNPDFTSYAMGWHVNPYHNNEISHGGANPNFTSYIALRPKEKIGVAVLANSNSPFTQYIGDNVLKLLTGQEVARRSLPEDRVDAFCSILSIVLGLFLILMIIFILVRLIGVFRGKNKYVPLTWGKVLRMFVALLGSLPFLYGIYLIPQALAGLSWEAILVWAPISFSSLILMLLAGIVFSYIRFVLSLILPSRSKYRNELPQIAIVSILSGLAGTGILFIVTTAFFSTMALGYLLFYFGLVYLINVGGRKIAQTKMINISNNIALDLRIDLINKLFITKYQYFEKIDAGRIFATLNNDTGVLAGSAGLVISISTSMITLISGFIYMTTISVLSTAVVIGVTIALVLYYRLVAQKSRVFMEEARDSVNVYMSLLNGTIGGYKELSIHRRKKYEFKKDLINSTEINCNKSIKAAIKFLNANLIGDSIGYIVLGVLSIVISRLVTGASVLTLISFVMVILYLLEPIRAIINFIPNLTRLRVSWDRIKGFVKDIDLEGDQESVKEFIKNLDLAEKEETIDLEVLNHLQKNIETLKVNGLMFEYEIEGDEQGFLTGPIDFELEKGEVLFIIGGNGSGKTTAAKLVTGLYLWDKGSIKINDIETDASLVGEYFSTIYSNYHLFKKIYGVDLKDKETLSQRYLKLLNLHEKLELKNGEYSTLNLSGGQRKRLALFQCFIEDRPIYLFDEVAADQDPQFRQFFYRKLLPQMKKQGKLVIAITHDDHYFDVADKVIKMEMGKIDMICKGNEFGTKMMAFSSEKSLELEST